MKSKIKSSETKSFDIAPVTKFDLSLYLGKWYEIARFDHHFERGLSFVSAEYQFLGKDKIRVINTGYDSRANQWRKVIGKAKITSMPGLLRVSFFWIFYSDYRVLALGDNYEWALVGAGLSTKYLWLLSRTSILSQEATDNMLKEAKRRGYDIKKLSWIEQLHD